MKEDEKRAGYYLPKVNEFQTPKEIQSFTFLIESLEEEERR